MITFHCCAQRRTVSDSIKAEFDPGSINRDSFMRVPCLQRQSGCWDHHPRHRSLCRKPIRPVPFKDTTDRYKFLVSLMRGSFLRFIEVIEEHGVHQVRCTRWWLGCIPEKLELDPDKRRLAASPEPQPIKPSTLCRAALTRKKITDREALQF